MASASNLREQFRSLSKDAREQHQEYCIRVWRGLSWLERAEGVESTDLESRFIFAWIAFNALYGRRDEKGRPWGDIEAMGTFLATVWRLDHDDRLRRVLSRRQLQVLKLIESKHLSRKFWDEGEAAAIDVKRELRDALKWFGTPKMLRVLQLLFDRLYVMRNQVMHGASTKGSSLNRRTLQGSGGILLDLLPEMLAVMIERGIEHDWGRVWFPPQQ